MTNHDAIRELLEEFSLGALDSGPRTQVEDHLATGCAECDATLRELGELSVELARTLPQYEPVLALEERIVSRIATVKNPAPPAPAAFRHVSWVVAGLAAAACVALLIKVGSLQNDISRLEGEIAEVQDVTNLLNSPGMQFVDLKGVEPNAQAFGKVVVDPDRGSAVVYMYRLPQTPAGMEYQLWIMREGKPTSAGLFTVSDEGVATLVLNDFDDMPDSTSFLVTIESAGGSNAPTGMMYLTGPSGGSTGP